MTEITKLFKSKANLDDLLKGLIDEKILQLQKEIKTIEEEIKQLQSVYINKKAEAATYITQYNQLEQEHIIYTINKKGAFVASEKNGEIDRVELYKTLEGLKEKGVEKDEILDLLNKIYGGD